MKVWTVTFIDSDDGCYPFAFSYRSKHDAVQAVEGHAIDAHNFLVDPNSEDSQEFPGLTWDDAMSKATDVRDCEYWITETVLQ